METQDKIKEIEKEMEGLDGRSKEYKQLKSKLEELQLQEKEKWEEISEEITEENKTLETPESVDSLEVEAEIVEPKEEEFKNKSIVPTEVYEKIMSFNGMVKSEDLGWLFKTYNTIFGQTLKKCLCSGKVKRMVSKIRVTYERDNNIKK